MSCDKEILTMKKISKVFPGVKALNNVDFKLREGEVNTIVGETGAGKSTLIKVLTGAEEFGEGEVILNGKKIIVKSPIHSENLGISVVYQELNLCANLSVAENITIGREPKHFGKIHWKKVNEEAKRILSYLNISIDVTKLLGSYPAAIRQMVAIGRALYNDFSKILILDEPTSCLDQAETVKLFEVIDMLKAKGMGIIFITNFLDQVYRVSDRITILRNGELVGEYKANKLPKINLIGKMLGKEFDKLSVIEKEKSNSNSSDIKNVFLKTVEFGKKFNLNPVNIYIKKGEVMGLAGLLGSGRTELARLLFGLDRANNGFIYIKNIKRIIKSPIKAIKNSIALCPENRKEEGIIGDLSVKENIILALQAKKGIFKYISNKEQEKIANKYVNLLNIKTCGLNQAVKDLSGGNQQKVILARWLATKPSLLILDEPTSGIDICAKAEIQKLIVELAKNGMAVVFISSKFEELIRCCNNIVVLRDRNKVDELYDSEIDEKIVMKSLVGGI